MSSFLTGVAIGFVVSLSLWWIADMWHAYRDRKAQQRLYDAKWIATFDVIQLDDGTWVTEQRKKP